jgi:hypothetical protein
LPDFDYLQQAYRTILTALDEEEEAMTTKINSVGTVSKEMLCIL